MFTTYIANALLLLLIGTFSTLEIFSHTFAMMMYVPTPVNPSYIWYQVICIPNRIHAKVRTFMCNENLQ